MKELISGIGGVCSTDNFVGRAWIGRPPERCRNQRGHPAVINNRSSRSAAALVCCYAASNYRKGRSFFFFFFFILETANRYH